MKYGQYLRSTLKHGSVYGIGIILSRLIGFIMLPIYTRILTPADYGVLEILSMTIDLLAFATALGLTAAVTRYFYFYEDPADRAAVVSSAMLLMIGLFFIVTIITLPFSTLLSKLLLGNTEQAGLVRLAVILFFLGSLIEIPFVYLRAKQASAQVVAFNVLRLILSLSLNILFVVILRWGVRGILVSSIIASAITGAFMFTTTVRETGFAIRWPIVTRMARYGTPLLVLYLGSFALHNSDRYFLRAYASMKDVGVYALAYKLAMLISLFIGAPFNQIWLPKALEIEKKEGANAPPVLREILSYFNLVLVTTAMALSVFGELIVRIMAGPEFAGAGRPVPVLCLAMVLFASRNVSQIPAMIRERSDLIAISTGIAAVAVIALNFLLIPTYGVMGAAWATVGGFAIEYAIMSILAVKVYPSLVPFAGFVRLWGAAIVAFGAARLVVPGTGSILALTISGIGAMITFFVLLVITGAVSAEQRQDIVYALRNPAEGLRSLRAG